MLVYQRVDVPGSFQLMQVLCPGAIACGWPRWRMYRQGGSAFKGFSRHMGSRWSRMFCNTLGVNTTLPETNSEFTPGNGWLEYYFLFGMAYFEGLC